MSLDRTIIISGSAQVQLLNAVIGSNWQAMQAAGHPLAVRLYEHKERRTQEQQSLMWIRLGEIADQAWIGGRQYSSEVWHEQMKREYLPDEEGPTKRCRKDYRKWAHMPNGDRALIGSTTQLTTFGMAEYLTALMAWAATELGVMFSATPNEMRGT